MNHISKISFPVGLFFISVSPLATLGASKLTFEGNDRKVLEVSPDKSSGLDKIYVAYDLSGVTACYTSSPETSNVKFYKYSNLGGGYAEEITDVVREGNEYRLSSIEGDMGYIVEDGDERSYFWIVDYIRHQFIIDNVDVSHSQDCDTETLLIDGYGDPIYYYTINGQQRVLSRDIIVKYLTLEWDSKNVCYRQLETKVPFDSMGAQLIVRPASLSATEYTVEGDRFLQSWGIPVSSSSVYVQPHAVEVRTDVEQLNIPDGDMSNIISGDTSGLGGSAPAEITFYAYVTDGVMHEEWQMSDDPEFENVTHHFSDRDLTYTFTEDGVYYLRFIGSNSDGSCDAYGDVYTVNIGTSELLCPNAFSPNGDGVNDVWKISYRSLLEFECWIFDRAGKQLYHFNDPSGGWDGKYKGKIVSPGVYYYVIQAVGADGKKYKKSGDINIIRYRGGTGSSGSNPTE